MAAESLITIDQQRIGRRIVNERETKIVAETDTATEQETGIEIGMATGTGTETETGIVIAGTKRIATGMDERLLLPIRSQMNAIG